MTTRSELERNVEQHLRTEAQRVTPEPGWTSILGRAATGSQPYDAEQALPRRARALTLTAAAAAMLLAVTVGLVLDEPSGEPVATVDDGATEGTEAAPDDSTAPMPPFVGLEATVDSGREFDEIDFTTPLGREGTVRLPAGTLEAGPAEHGWEIVTARPDRHQFVVLRGSAEAWGNESCQSGLTLAPNTRCNVSTTPLDEGASLHTWSYSDDGPADPQTSAIELSSDTFIPLELGPVQARTVAERWQDSMTSIGTSPQRPAFKVADWPIERSRVYLTAPTTGAGLLSIEIGDTCSDAAGARCVGGFFVALTGGTAPSELLESVEILERPAP